MQTKTYAQLTDEMITLKEEIERLRSLEEKHCAQESELHFYQEIIENIAEGVYLIRICDGAIVYTNPKFEQMFGYGPGEMINQHVSIVNAESDTSPEDIAKDIMLHLSKHGSWFGEVYNVRKNGEKFWCHANVSKFNHSESLLSGLKKRKRLESLTSGVYGRIAVVETAFLPTQRQA